MVVLRQAMDFCESLAKALVESGQAQGSSFEALWKQAVKAVAKDSGDEAKAIHAAFKENPKFYKNNFKSQLQKAQEKQEKAAQKRGGKKSAAAAATAKGIAAPSELAQFVLGMPAQSPAALRLADSVEAAEEVIANLCRHRSRRAANLLHEAFELLESNYTSLTKPDATLRAMTTYLQLHRRDHTTLVNVRRVFALFTCILHHVQTAAAAAATTTLHPSAGIVWTLEDLMVACAYLLRYWHRDPTDTTRRMCVSALNELAQKLRAAGHGSTGSSSSDPTSGKSVAVYAVVAAAAIIATLQKQPAARRLVDNRLESELTRSLRSWGQIVWQPVYERVVEVLLRCLDFGDLDAKEDLKAVERVRLDDIVRYLVASAEDTAALGEVLIHLTTEHQRDDGAEDDEDEELNEEEGDDEAEEDEEEDEGEEVEEEEAGEGDSNGEVEAENANGANIDELLEDDYSEPDAKKGDDLLGFVVDTAAAAKVDELAAMTEAVISPPQTRSKRKAKSTASAKKQQQPEEEEQEEKEAPPTTRKRTRKSTRS